MNHESDDAMFEVLLAEAAGGPHPPDLSGKILAALEAQRSSAPLPPNPLPANPLPPNPLAANPLAVNPLAARPAAPALVTPAAPRRRGHRRTVLACAWVASLAASVVLAGLFFSRPALRPAGPTLTAGDPATDPPSGSPQAPQGPATRSAIDASVAPGAAPNPPASVAPEDSGSSPRGLGGDTTPTPAPRALAADDAGAEPSERGFPVTDPTPGFARDPAEALASAAPIDPAAAYPPPPEPLADEAIVARIDALLASAWQSTGTEPTAEVDAATWNARLNQLLGTTVALAEGDSARPSARVGVSESIRRALQDPRARQTVSRKFARTLLGRVGTEQLSESQREAFARWLSPAIGGEVAFDAVAAEMLTARGSSAPEAEDFNPASVWLSGLAGPRSVPLVEQFGHAMLDMDLRCGRCHDHPLDGRVWQNQYWELNAVFQTSLRWSANRGRALRVETVPPSARGADAVVFFELPDGRQRAVPPRAAWQWIAGSAESDDAEQIARQAGDLEGLAAALDNNPQLARAAVNRLWETVYGGPLIGSAADPSAPPESEPLLELQAELAAQLRAHDFNLARALSWIAAAAPMRLKAPAALEAERYELASDAELRGAGEQLRQYAAYPPALPRQEFSGLVAMVQRWSGEPTALAPRPDVLLGQAADSQQPDPKRPNPKQPDSQQPDSKRKPSGQRTPQPPAGGAEAQVLRAIYDSSATTDPVPWLSRVGSSEDYDERALHLFYLAGYWNPSASQRAAAESLRSGGDDQAALSRLWWILSREK
ncbi:DUF1549 domain-containing protein [Candidatus Laterigemmans baculatus]|uniref:DUF1549 domain-containing protein n=1 Tax=Candidatus Laterigemmans baculatus TaxID=2770505 RepID=UPI0013DBC04D|nr:DUF1549 domain-containing protein [Candidatus Laterigemmans baculatus]